MRNLKLSFSRKQTFQHPTGRQLVVSLIAAAGLILWANLLAGNFN